MRFVTSSNNARWGVWLSSHSLGRPLAAIFGCVGLSLSKDEAEFFERCPPFGFILFKRNVESPTQIRALVDQLKTSVGRAESPIFIDQEGGRVARLGPPHWPVFPPAANFGRLALDDSDAACEAMYAQACLIAHELNALAISVNCAPVLDVAVEGAHTVIGDRAFSDDPHIVAMLGRAYCDGLLASGVLPVLKHIPGHGHAKVDSHQALPRVDLRKPELVAADFLPFRKLCDMPLAMTAHVGYTDVDGPTPATVSARLIEDVIRKDIGFEGLLLSDDISMHALDAGYADLGERTVAALQAGCDLVLHCNADSAEMRSLAAVCEPVSDVGLERWGVAEQLLNTRRVGDTPAPDDLAKRRDALLARA